MTSDTGHRSPVTRLLCFDLDGVLYSSEPFIADSYRESIARVNERRPGSFERVPSTQEILAHVGWPVSTILQRLFPHVDEEATRLLYEVTLDVISARVEKREGVLFPGVAETLRALAADYLLAVASNGRSRYVESVLRTYELAGLFVPRVTADQTRDKAAILRAYLARYSLGAHDIIMIGDRTSDVEAAVAVGCPFIGCDYGHGHREEIEGAGPIVGSFAEIAEAVACLRAV
jgi:phosphoglycolate phosphatase-like HAD superfamily hydrolase